MILEAIIAYVVVTVLVARYVYQQELEDVEVPEALFVGLFWPFLLPFYVLYLLVKGARR